MLRLQHLAIVYANSDTQELDEIELLLHKNFGSEYVIEIGETAKEAMNIIETLDGISVKTGVLLTNSVLKDSSGMSLIHHVAKKYPHMKCLLIAEEIPMEELSIAINTNIIHQLIKRPWHSEGIVKTIAEAAKAFVQSEELEALDKKLRHSEQEKSLILNSIAEALLYVDMNYEIKWSNQVAKDMMANYQLNGHCFNDIYRLKTPCGDCPMETVLHDQEPVSVERRFGDHDYKLVRYYPVFNRQNQPIGIVITLLDITARKIAEDMNRSLLEISKFINKSESTLEIYKMATTYLEKYYHLKLMCIAGEDYDNTYIEFLSENKDLISKEQIVTMLNSLHFILDMNEKEEFIVLRNEIGSIVLQQLQGKLLLIIVDEDLDKDGNLIKFLNAIAEQVKTGVAKIENLKKIMYQANHDANTGLYNRDYFMNLLDRVIKNKRYHDDVQHQHSLAVIDLNYFKEVNDTFGHMVGDEVLAEIATRLTHAIRNTDTLARMGGDEFAILFSQHNKRQMIHMIKRIQDTIAKPISLKGTQISIGSSVGIVFNIFAYNQIVPLFRDADSAMYEAKNDKSGIGHYVFYEKDVQAKFERHHEIESYLKKAKPEQDFELVYQPILDMKTLEIKGYEGLLRWRDKNGAQYTPNEFIPIADETDEIYGIGEAVVHRALEAVNAFNVDKYPYYVSINLTSKQLLSTRYLAMIKRSIVEQGISSNRLQVDITERFRDNSLEQINKRVNELRDFGVHVNLDDFGTGISSLKMLNSINISEIKIDASFIKKMRWDEEARKMVKSTISLANSMGISVTAEGVEKKEEFDMLQEMGCHLAQGYYISKPLELKDAGKFKFVKH